MLYNSSMIAVSKRRRFLKWTGLGACLFFGLSWLLGLYVSVLWTSPGGQHGFVAHSGALYFYKRSVAPWLWRPGWHTYVSLRAPSEWLPRVEDNSPVSVNTLLITPVLSLTLPLWIPFVLALALAAFYWRPRVPKGCCGQCGYNLTGNVSGRCPECGADARSKAL